MEIVSRHSSRICWRWDQFFCFCNSSENLYTANKLPHLQQCNSGSLNHHLHHRHRHTKRQSNMAAYGNPIRKALGSTKPTSNCKYFVGPNALQKNMNNVSTEPATAIGFNRLLQIVLQCKAIERHITHNYSTRIIMLNAASTITTPHTELCVYRRVHTNRFANISTLMADGVGTHISPAAHHRAKYLHVIRLMCMWGSCLYCILYI